MTQHEPRLDVNGEIIQRHLEVDLAVDLKRKTFGLVSSSRESLQMNKQKPTFLKHIRDKSGGYKATFLAEKLSERQLRNAPGTSRLDIYTCMR